MKKIVLSNIVVAILVVAAVFISCNKDDEDNGLLISELYNNQKMPIGECFYSCYSEETIKGIFFESPSGISVAGIDMEKANIKKITSKTYAANELIGPTLRGLDSKWYYDDGKSIIMKVEVRGKIFDITITGKVLIEDDYMNGNTSNGIEYKITYKGKIKIPEGCIG